IRKNARLSNPTTGRITASLWFKTASTRSTQSGISRRRQKVFFNPLDDRLLRLGFTALRDPFGIGLECIPFGFTLSQAFPFQQIGQRMVARAGNRGPEPDLLDPVFLKKPSVMLANRSFNAGRRPGAQ